MQEVFMSGSSPERPLQADQPEVIVLGDIIIDWHIYDMRAEDADQTLAWTSPLSRDDWYYSAGFRARYCLAGAAGIHAMLWANQVPVAGNSFPIVDACQKPTESGSIFVLRQRSNAGKTKEERTRTYLMESPDNGWRAAGEANAYAKVATDRAETWRAALNFLKKSGEPYVDAFDGAKHEFNSEALKVVCLWDVGRGFFRSPTDEDQTKRTAWEVQQLALVDWYKKLSKNRKQPILIRTSDPSRFEHFLKKLAEEPDAMPTVIMVCALAQLNGGDLKGSGTWSDVWSQTYDYLRKKDYLISQNNNWKFHILIPVHEDGVIWVGPDCWPIGENDRTPDALRDDKLPLGRLFMVPGTQPSLSEFEEHGRIIGVHGLLTYSILEHLAGTPTTAELANAIRKGLMRSRRLRSHGYCTPDELFSFEDSGQQFHINFPREIWRKTQREATDRLLLVKDPRSSQYAGPYEVICKVELPDPEGPDHYSPTSMRIFYTIEKTISDEFVASPMNCIRVIGDMAGDDDPLDRLKINDHWLKVDDEPCPLDSFAKQEIESFGLRQRISMQFGNFAMADKEAARILDLAQRIRQHVFSNRYNSPEKGSVFNCALFGSPGSGKSFLAREIARLIDLKGAIFTVDEFNLSQFNEPAQLTRALATIASKSVGGTVPLVLWDEFDSVLDSQRGGWLARFLMPMQDAHFFDGRQKWPIGTAVFVFIGGTFSNADEFRAWACTPAEPGKEAPEAVLLKARDFHSRLYTALDMPSIVDVAKPDSIDREIIGDHRGGPGLRYQIFRLDWRNSYTKLARAVLLRGFFRDRSKIGKTPFLQHVEEDLCRFLLAIPLRHGARSLQRIVEACLVSKPSRVSIRHLPPLHFLEEHIETENVQLFGRKTMGMTIQEMIEACRS
jgi:ATPase family associated with various cellular activities (AAA)